MHFTGVYYLFRPLHGVVGFAAGFRIPRITSYLLGIRLP